MPNPIQRYTHSAWLVILCAAFLSLACSRLPSQEKNKVPHPNSVPEPLLSVQQQFLSINVNEISGLRFYGDDFGCYNDHPIEVTDISLITKFLNALRHATGRHAPVLDYLDDMEIHLKPKGRTLRPPIHLKYLAAIELDGFGAEFRDALKALSRHQASLVHKQVQSQAKWVKQIKIETEIKVEKARPIDKHGEVVQYLAALKQIDERAFDYTVGGDSSLDVTLVLNNGKEIPFHFVFYTAKEANGETSPPLPGILWDYYLASRATHK